MKFVCQFDQSVCSSWIFKAHFPNKTIHTMYLSLKVSEAVLTILYFEWFCLVTRYLRSMEKLWSKYLDLHDYSEYEYSLKIVCRILASSFECWLLYIWYKKLHFYCGFFWRVTILRDKETRESKGVAFVLFLDRQTAHKAVAAVNKKQVHYQLHVINPLHLNISMHILHVVLYTFP